MTKKFNQKGIPSITVCGDTDPQERNSAISRLRKGEVKLYFH